MKKVRATSVASPISKQVSGGDEEAKTSALNPELFHQVMGSRDLAPLVLQHLNTTALINYSQTSKLGYQRATQFHWGKSRLIDQGFVVDYLIEHASFYDRIGEQVLRKLYFTLRNNRRFSRDELGERCTINPLMQATFGEGTHLPFYLIALMGRTDLLIEHVTQNPNFVRLADSKWVVSELMSATKHRVSFYLVYAQHFNQLSALIKSGHMTTQEIYNTSDRENIFYAGGCAGVINIEDKVKEIYQYQHQMTLREKIIFASGLITCNHLQSLELTLLAENISVIEILRQNPECLYAAAENGHREMVKLILAEIASHNVKNRRLPENQFLPSPCDAKKRSLLHYFAYHGWQEEFLELADIPKDEPHHPIPEIRSLRLSPTQPDINGEIPLIFAVRGGKLSMVKFCHDHQWGNVKETEGQYGFSTLDVAIDHKQNHLIDPIIDYFKVDVKEVNRIALDPLLSCANLNNWQAFIQLSRRFEDPLSSKTPSGRTLVHVAALQIHIAFLRQLKAYCLKKGLRCYVNTFHSIDNEGNTLLHKLCQSKICYFGNFSIIFEEFDCRLYQENHHHENPIHTLLLLRDTKPERWNIVAKIIQKYDTENRLLQSTNRDGKSILELAKEAGKAHLFDLNPTNTL